MRTAIIEILNLVSKNNIASSRFWLRTATFLLVLRKILLEASFLTGLW